jgi:hypothetical protein
MRTQALSRASRLASVLALLAALAVGCKPGTENVPPDSDIPAHDVVGTDATDTAPPSDVQDAADAQDAAPIDGSADAADATADGSADAASCVGDGGCVACPPVTLSDYLNQCTGSACAPFDNHARLPLWDGGALPPLP